jgi:SAM-dependent MidA family methyltransferase
MIETTSIASLADRLSERIRREGPITFYDWMKASLYDATEGYYYRADLAKWGREGDYRTSPERSTLFAATFARYFAGLHQELGQPGAWTILEAGAGDGRFAHGLLETLQRFFPGVFAATSYVIDEVSPSSRQTAQERLRPFADRIQFQTLDEATFGPGVVFANELLDAFPVHRVTFHEGALREFKVTLSDDGRFEWLLAAPATSLSLQLAQYFADAGVQPGAGQVVEVNLEIEEWLRRVAARMDRGYVVIVDYGAGTDDLHLSSADRNGTLRGFRQHQFVDDLLANPGDHDLTTTVNWSVVKTVATRLGFEDMEFQRQDQFLLQAGFLEQLEAESALAANEAERLRLTTAAREMILPSGMAASFQVLVLKKSPLFGVR